MTHQDKIDKLKKELAKYSEKDDGRLQILKNRKEIEDLKKQIRDKKYAGLKQAGKNLKVIGKNVGIITKAIGKGTSKFIGEDPQRKGKKPRTVEEMMRDLPQ